MPEYRIYKVDLDGYLFDVPHVVMRDNDQDAIEKAQHMAHGLDLEVWQVHGASLALRLFTSAWAAQAA